MTNYILIFWENAILILEGSTPATILLLYLLNNLITHTVDIYK